MKIDRMFFNKFEDKAKTDPVLQEKVEAGQWDQAVDHVTAHLFNKPSEYFNLDKLRKAVGVDRRLTIREILEKVFGLIPGFKSKDDLLDEEFQKFLLDCQPEEAEAILPIKSYFKAYATDGKLRDIIDSKHFGDLNVNPTFDMGDFKSVPLEWRNRIPEYVKDYVPLNQFM